MLTEYFSNYVEIKNKSNKCLIIRYKQDHIVIKPDNIATKVNANVTGGAVDLSFNKNIMLFRKRLSSNCNSRWRISNYS
jgi:hypothetical protein